MNVPFFSRFAMHIVCTLCLVIVYLSAWTYKLILAVFSCIILTLGGACAKIDANCTWYRYNALYSISKTRGSELNIA